MHHSGISLTCFWSPCPWSTSWSSAFRWQKGISWFNPTRDVYILTHTLKNIYIYILNWIPVESTLQPTAYPWQKPIILAIPTLEHGRDVLKSSWIAVGYENSISSPCFPPGWHEPWRCLRPSSKYRRLHWSETPEDVTHHASLGIWSFWSVGLNSMIAISYYHILSLLLYRFEKRWHCPIFGYDIISMAPSQPWQKE